ncbi:hypothetical protein Lesp01_06560 [Lentzea sp. NBRC 102530]|nr:hypothetical protein Lesp01_06560 [Lentzea sp. NBRC 102530]
MLDREFPEPVVSGGGSRSDLMMQILATVFARPVRRTRTSDAAGLARHGVHRSAVRVASPLNAC